MRSAERNVRAAQLALALFLLVFSASARGADLAAQVRSLFESGSKTTPSAIRAADAQYAKLKAEHASDPRIDYAYGVVLVNQRRYREASGVFAGYLATDEPKLAAYCLQIGLLLPLREYGESLEQAGLLARRLSDDPDGSSEDDRQDAATFLGTVFRYLELPRKGALASRLVSRSKREVLALLDDDNQAAFQQGYNAVAKRVSEFQAEQKLHAEQRIETIASQKERDRQAIDEAKVAGGAAEEQARLTQEQLREIERQYADLQKQMAPFATQRSAVEAAIIVRQTQIQEASRNNNVPVQVTQALWNEVLILQVQRLELNRRFNVLRTSAAALEAKAAQHNFSLASAENESRRSERLGLQANRRVERAEDELAKRSTTAVAKLTSFTTYAGFSYDLEKKRVLSWFSK